MPPKLTHPLPYGVSSYATLTILQNSAIAADTLLPLCRKFLNTRSLDFPRLPQAGLRHG